MQVHAYMVYMGYLANASTSDNGMFKFDDQETNYEDSLTQATSFINALNINFEEKGVNLLIENLFPAKTRRTSSFLYSR